MKFKISLLFYKIFICGTFFISLSANLCFSQIDPIFSEDQGSLTLPFQAVRGMANRMYENKYKALHRKEGNEIKLLMQNGSVFTRMLHKSGTINFNSDATRYLNALKNYLLKDYPKVAAAINVYITFNPSLNAFAIIENHSVEHYRKMKKQVDSIGKSDMARKADESEISKHNMSQQHEFEADKLGVHLFLLAGYESKHAYDALLLLKNADVDLEQKAISKEILHVSDERYEALLDALKKKELGKDVVLENSNKIIIDLNDDSHSDRQKSDNDDELTHPHVEERLLEVNKLIQEFDRIHQGKASFIVDENKFQQLKTASLNMVNTSHNKSCDFISAFIINAGKFAGGQNVSNKDVEHFAYAIFGLIHDRKYKMRYSFTSDMGHVDSVFTLYFRQSTLQDLTLWGLNVLEAKRTNDNAEIIDDYIRRIVRLVLNEKNMKVALNAYTERFGIQSFENKSLKFDDIDFRISMSNNLTNHEKKNFNKQQRAEVKKQGKIAFIDMNNVVVDVQNYSAGLNFKKSDRLDDLNYSVFQQLTARHTKDLMLMIPNGVSYNGKQYDQYAMLLNWISERIYFDQTPYKSLYQDQIRAFQRDNDVRYIMLGVNLVINQRAGFSLYRMAGLVLNPLYFPLVQANRIISKSRNYQLTVIFDLESGELVLWDKRTSIEPLTEAFVYNTYDDIISIFRK